MSISPVIDSRYRLHPHDLGRRERVVTIQNVSQQGVEVVAPLLHLREFPGKLLLLEPIQCQELAQITGTTHQPAWIGHQVLVAAQSDVDRLRIHLFDPTVLSDQIQPPPRHPARRFRTHSPRQFAETLRGSLLLLLLLGLLFIAAAALNDSSPFWQWIGF